MLFCQQLNTVMHTQLQLAPMRQLLPPLGRQLLASAHIPFVLPPELHPAKVL